MRLPHDMVVVVADGSHMPLPKNHGDQVRPDLRVIGHRQMENPPNRELLWGAPGLGFASGYPGPKHVLQKRPASRQWGSPPRRGGRSAAQRRGRRQRSDRRGSARCAWRVAWSLRFRDTQDARRQGPPGLRQASVEKITRLLGAYEVIVRP
jgi:hypothetical protein